MVRKDATTVETEIIMKQTSTGGQKSHLMYTSQGLTIGLGGDIDISKVLTPEQRILAKAAYRTGSLENGLEAGESYPVWLFYVFACFFLYSLYKSVTHPDVTLLFAVVMFVVTLLFTDFVSGVFHLVLDNPNNIGTFPIDDMCRGFQEHHLDPTLIYKMPLFEHVRPMTQPLVFVFLLTMPLELIAGKTILSFQVYYCCLSFTLFYMQLCHRWAHLIPKERTPVIRMLQKMRLAIPPGEHLQHHAAPYEKDFCIVNGMCNPILNFIVQIPIFHPRSKIWSPIFLLVAYSPGVICLLATL